MVAKFILILTTNSPKKFLADKKYTNRKLNHDKKLSPSYSGSTSITLNTLWGLPTNLSASTSACYIQREKQKSYKGFYSWGIQLQSDNKQTLKNKIVLDNDPCSYERGGDKMMEMEKEETEDQVRGYWRKPKKQPPEWKIKEKPIGTVQVKQYMFRRYVRLIVSDSLSQVASHSYSNTTKTTTYYSI